MADGYYFPHDYYARQDEKIINLLSELGARGYGTYWILVEYFYHAAGTINKKTLQRIIERDNDLEEEIAYAVLKNYGLFTELEECFTCTGILERLSIRKAKSDAGKKGGESKK